METNLFDDEKTDFKGAIKAALLATNRLGIARLIEEMEDAGFFTAACSGGHHLCIEGGLAEHSWNVYENAHKMAKSLLKEDEYNAMEKSITIASLLHDLGKTGDFGKELYIPNVLKSGKVSASKPFKQNKELPPVPHAIHSAAFARRFIDLTPDEEWAILCHDGLYDYMRNNLKGAETPLMLIIHDADMWASRVQESETADEEAEE